MKKEYKFDKKALINDFFELKNYIIKNNQNQDETLINEFYLEAIYSILMTSKIDFNSPYMYPYLFISKNKLKENLKDTIKYYSTIFQNNVIKRNINEVVFECDLNFNDHKNKKIALEEQFDLIHQNFSKTKRLDDAHKKLFNPENHLINITKVRENNLFTKTNKNGYITNKNNNNIEDYITLCHEVGHFDESLLTNDRINKKMVLYNNKLNNYIEVYSIFYELVATYNLYKSKYITEKEMIYYFNNIKELNTFNIEYYLLSKDYINGIKNSNIKYIRNLKCDIKDISMYYYSYLIAITLFEKYIQDEEKAFYYLNYLVNNITSNNEKKILKYCDIDLYNSTLIKKHINRIKRNSIN